MDTFIGVALLVGAAAIAARTAQTAIIERARPNEPLTNGRLRGGGRRRPTRRYPRR